MAPREGVLWRVESVQREGPDAVRVRISPHPAAASEAVDLAPGGSMSFHLETTPRIRRSYSIISPIGAPYREFVVKNVRGGQASRYFQTELEVGTHLELVKQHSHMWQAHWDESPRHFIGFAGGIGIAPLFSCMQYALESGVPHRFTLYHSSPSERRSLLKADLARFEDHPRASLVPLYTETLMGHAESHRITPAQVKRWISAQPNREQATYLICGPHGMMEAVHLGLDACGIPQEHRFTEFFTNRPLSHGAALPASARHAQRPNCVVEIEQDTGVSTFEMHGEGHSILKAARQAGIDVPSSCSGGVCLSCQAEILEGAVQGHGISGLTEAEKARGMVLCCRAQPKSNRLRLRLVNG